MAITKPDYFEVLKNDLDITWTDTDGDEKLAYQCKRAESFLSKKAGETISFTLDMSDQDTLQLLFDCVRYIRSASLNEFEQNYFEDLEMLRMNYQAATITDSTAEDTTSDS